MKRESAFKTEAELCAAFLTWLKAKHPEIKAYAEWAGWDILLVYPNGSQLGVQAKLRLNAEVILQAVPQDWWDAYDSRGPDFRAVLVPQDRGPLAGVAAKLGIGVFEPFEAGYRPSRTEFRPRLDHAHFVDWNPCERETLPPTDTDAVAGSPCPVTLSHWKLGALDVLAELALRGTITAKRIKDLGISPSRWLSCRWVEPAETRGLWVRGERCPKFDEQHPSAYALALAKAQAAAEKLSA